MRFSSIGDMIREKILHQKFIEHPSKIGGFTVLKRQVPYDSGYGFRAIRDSVIRPDGTRGFYSYAEFPSGAYVAPIDENGNATFLSETIYPWGEQQPNYKCITGGPKKEDMDSKDTASREMLEEAGLVAKTLIRLGKTGPFDCINSPQDLYLALDLTQVQPAREPTEEIEVIKRPLDEAIEKVEEAPSSRLLYKARDYLKK